MIESGREYAEDDPERFYIEVEALLQPLIDFPRFARNVMGAYYRKADDAQRERFAESFKWSLVRTYALALTEFGGGEIEVLEPRLTAVFNKVSAPVESSRMVMSMLSSIRCSAMPARPGVCVILS